MNGIKIAEKQRPVLFAGRTGLYSITQQMGLLAHIQPFQSGAALEEM